MVSLSPMSRVLDKKKHSGQKNRFLVQARRLFAAHGIMETSMSQIAKACKVTKAGLYHYFKSKDAVVKEIFLSHADEREQIVALLNKAKNLEECLYLMGKHHLEEMTRPDNKELMRIMLSETMKNAEMRKFYEEFITGQIAYIVQEILAPKACCPKPEKEVRLLFFQFFASLMHYSWHQMMVSDLTPLIGDGETFIKSLSRTYAMRLQER